MSVAELLPAIRALSKAEQVQLMHLILDNVAGTQPTADEPDHFCALAQPGFVAEIWFPEANPDAVLAASRALNDPGAKV